MRTSNRLGFAITLLLLIGSSTEAVAQAQLPVALPPLTWKELMQCELVVAGRYNDHSDRQMALEVVDVLRGKACKSGDILQVKLGPQFVLETGKPWQAGGKKTANAHLQYRHRGAPQGLTYFGNAARLAVWFFPKADAPALNRLGQFQPDFRDGWKQALTGKQPNLFFRLMQRTDQQMREPAVEELFRKRDPTAIGRLLDWWIAPVALSMERDERRFVQRILFSLGDKNGDLYDAVKKRINTKSHLNDRWSKAALCQALARADGKRAVAEFRRMLKSGKYDQEYLALWGSIELENEDALNMLLDALQNSKQASEAAHCLRALLRGEQREVQSAITMAHLQKIGYPRLRNIMKSGVLPQRVQGPVGYPSYFGFLHGYWSVPRGSPPNAYSSFPLDAVRFGRKEYHWEQFTKWQKNADWQRLMYADLAYGRFHLEKVLAAPQGKYMDALAVTYGYDDYRKALEAAQGVKAAASSDDTLFLRPLLWDAVYRKRYLKYVDGLMAKPTSAGTTHLWLALRPLYPEHVQEYFQRGMDWAAAEDDRARHAGVHLLKSKLHWDFDLNVKDLIPVHRRKAVRARQMLQKIMAPDMVRLRANLLREFGIELKGEPSSKWLPPLREAALHPYPTIRFNAVHIIAMLVGDDKPRWFPVDAKSGPWLEKLLNDFFHERDAKLKRSLTDAQFENLWSELARKDWHAAQVAMRNLLAAPKSALPRLRQKLIPRNSDAKHCKELIANLGSKSFRVRAKASAELKNLGRRAHAPLLEALKKPHDLEVALRIRKVLQTPRWSPEHKQMVHAIDVLQNLGMPEALTLLEELARRSDALAVTHEARNALRRSRIERQW